MKIKLIAPHEQRKDTISSPFKLQRVNLPLLAALTPPGHTITIVEEVFAPDDINQEVDLVGITVLTELALRAYHIGDTYRRKGVKVVMGGIHPTVLPEEALEHADAVVVGEAEGVWPQLVAEAASGQMQRIYRAGKMTDLQGLPKPRRDLLPGSRAQGVYSCPDRRRDIPRVSVRLRILLHWPDLGAAISGQARSGGDCRDSIY